MSALPAVVRLRGGGVAAATAAHLLAEDGFEVAGGGAPAGGAPVVMLSEAALGLLRNVFARPRLFTGRTPIERRVVAWGGGEVAAVSHVACVVDGPGLIRELASSATQQQSPSSPRLRGDDATVDESVLFTLDAAMPNGTVRRFGSRPASASIVELAAASDQRACHVEATAAGWLFLIPTGAGRAWLLSVGGDADAQLGTSRLVAAQVAALGPVAARFETAPRILETPAGDDWMALGTSAIAFDPICGDGTAQAVREAILAAAVIAGIRDGGDAVALIGHYRAMLLASMRRHLQISLSFYRSGGTSPWWREQAEALAQGHAWCTARLGALPEPQFLLKGTRLVPRALAA